MTSLEKYICNTCQKVYKTETGLSRHISQKHSSYHHHHHHHHHHHQNRANITKNLKDRNLMRFLKNLSTLWQKMSATQKILGINLKL